MGGYGPCDPLDTPLNIHNDKTSQRVYGFSPVNYNITHPNWSDNITSVPSTTPSLPVFGDVDLCRVPAITCHADRAAPRSSPRGGRLGNGCGGRRQQRRGRRDDRWTSERRDEYVDHGHEKYADDHVVAQSERHLPLVAVRHVVPGAQQQCHTDQYLRANGYRKRAKIIIRRYRYSLLYHTNAIVLKKTI